MDPSRVPAGVLVAGDATAFVLFAVIGLANHEEGITAGGVARNAIPLAAGFFVAAAVLGAYRRPGIRSLLVAWAVGVPVGVLIRAVALERPADGSQVVFGVVALVTTLVLLLAWRGIASLASRRRAA